MNFRKNKWYIYGKSTTYKYEVKPLDTDFTSRPFVSIFEPSCCPMKVTGWYRARYSSD